MFADGAANAADAGGDEGKWEEKEEFSGKNEHGEERPSRRMLGSCLK